MAAARVEDPITVLARQILALTFTDMHNLAEALWDCGVIDPDDVDDMAGRIVGWAQDVVSNVE